MTPELLAGAVAILLSLLFSYVPGFASWYVPLAADRKRLIMVGMLFVVSAGAFGLACLGWAVVEGLACTSAGLFGLVKVFIAALVANQAVYAISPQNTAQRETWRDKAESREGTPAKPRSWQNPKK